MQDANFDADQAQTSVWLHEALKFTALAWHLLTGVAIYALLKGKPGAIAASVYLLNPAALYDVAHWAQPDGAHSLFSVLAVGLLDVGQVVAPWASLGAAAMAKPQAWFLAPLLVLATFRARGVRGVLQGAAVAVAVLAVISLPFVVTGHGRELLGLPLAVSTVMPVVSADAHNFWWVVLQLRGQDPIFLQDSARLLGPLSYRLAAAALVGASVVLVCWLYWTRRASLAESAALGVLGWFTFTTQAHENHLFLALPLLSLAWPARRTLLVPFVVMSITLLLNMVLHDQLVLESLGAGIEDGRVQQLRLMNAILNVVCFGAWSAWASTRRSLSTVVDRDRSLGYSELVAVHD